MRSLVWVGLLAAMIPIHLATVSPARADDCLLDTNDDGNADSNVDTDKGANSNGEDDSLACGAGSKATGSRSTSLGAQSTASGDDALSTGFGAAASAERAVALGSASAATGIAGIAIGGDSRSIDAFADSDGAGAQASAD
ncbi:MAG: hypothetical protein HKO13_00035 [Sphingomonas sp.]|nr:hypothetical protein [Sphingomonas sp.]